MKGCVCFLLLTITVFCSFSEILEISCDRPVLVFNNHVGDEWIFDVKIDGQNCPIGRKVKIEGTGVLTLVFTVQEVDKVSDFGSGTLEIDLTDLDDNSKQYTYIEVIVSENRGRYRGYTAKWRMRVNYSKFVEPELLIPQSI